MMTKCRAAAVSSVGFLSLSVEGLVAPTVSFSVPRAATTAVRASTRREYLEGIILQSVVPVAAIVASNALPAQADIDYERVQDLLKDIPQSNDYQAAGPPSTGRPKWLTEPTDEFKENEKKSSEFKREQLQLKQDFVRTMEKFQTDPATEQNLAGGLDELRRIVRKGGGLPLGIKKEEVVKQVRRRKAQKFWPVNVEIAYQDLLAEIQYMQSPNSQRDKSFL